MSPCKTARVTVRSVTPDEVATCDRFCGARTSPRCPIHGDEAGAHLGEPRLPEDVRRLLRAVMAWRDGIREGTGGNSGLIEAYEGLSKRTKAEANECRGFA